MDVLFQAVDLVPKTTTFLTLNSNFSQYNQTEASYNHNKSHHNQEFVVANPSSNAVQYRNPPPRRAYTNPSTSAFRALNSLVHASANPVILNTIDLG